ncbi:hypothetical protein [Paenibacillus tyrfis]|uniref:Uncharacterized protein n=1 Tax=Paenibacillus tyrfis TaxID=1501230 RepID=A0A081NYA0_9BACL|nr:hypothetical protein [Paenibacillus tyrfis]KEQ23423.1 hypothetical protein ET33_16470 [Paenibacillus tyrfis]
MTEKKVKETSTYTVVRQLRHNDSKFKPGQPVELTEEEAGELLELGAVKVLEQPAEKMKSQGKNQDPEGTPEK